MGFVIDASGSMGLDKFSREKNFLKLVSRRFVDSSPDTRLGLISFSDTAKLFADFVEFERMGTDQFQKILDELPYQGGRTRIDRALMAASQHLFTKRRPGVQRVSEKRRYLTSGSSTNQNAASIIDISWFLLKKKKRDSSHHSLHVH